MLCTPKPQKLFTTAKMQVYPPYNLPWSCYWLLMGKLKICHSIAELQIEWKIISRNVLARALFDIWNKSQLLNWFGWHSNQSAAKYVKNQRELKLWKNILRISSKMLFLCQWIQEFGCCGNLKLSLTHCKFQTWKLAITSFALQIHWLSFFRNKDFYLRNSLGTTTEFW